jgi:hypothetical protein
MYICSKTRLDTYIDTYLQVYNQFVGVMIWPKPDWRVYARELGIHASHVWASQEECTRRSVDTFPTTPRQREMHASAARLGLNNPS